jgi:hypothetical protein
MGMCLVSARFDSPDATARTVRKHEPVRRDKRHATRVFNDRAADATVFGGPEVGGCGDRCYSQVEISGLDSTREVSG